MNVRVELVAREVPAEAAGSSPRISGTGSKHTSRVTLGRTHFESNVKKCSKVFLAMDLSRLAGDIGTMPKKDRQMVEQRSEEIAVADAAMW